MRAVVFSNSRLIFLLIEKGLSREGKDEWFGRKVRVVLGDNYGTASAPMGTHRTPIVSSTN